MADTKITALTALTAADPANDVIPIVDVSDTSMAASGTTKKISVNNILGAGGTATLASATITGDLTVDTNTLKVDSTNNRVGVNNATPSFPLDLSGIGSNTLFRLVGNLGTNIRFDTIRSFVSNRNWIVGCDEIGEGIFAIVPSTALGGSTFTNPVYKVSYDGIHTFLDGAGGTRMTLDASGNLLVGTTAVGMTAGGVRLKNGGGNLGEITLSNNSGAADYVARFVWGSGATLVGNITVSSVATVYNTTSDYRLKESVKPLSGGLARVNALKPSVYNWKSDGSTGEGFLAHELAEVVPAAVTGEKDAVNADGTIKSQGIDMSRVVPILVAAIQELTAEVNALKNA